MTLKTQLFSVDTLHVEVPDEIKSGDINERLEDYSEGNEHNGVDHEDGGLLVSRTDMIFNIAGYDNVPLRDFFVQVVELLKAQENIDEVYFHRAPGRDKH
jgi:hypothetical protein